ncbi:hypothetical protein EYF80_011001 [Liparis tanakae]|uniref:Uncharacterized protein n=1 Tax=Liparis tanakae TaxID=230148 RepID=A0A4Z2IM18_9TELE|nr:hypothetical protein EYF80_011001 [Liparis tanakae]
MCGKEEERGEEGEAHPARTPGSTQFRESRTQTLRRRFSPSFFLTDRSEVAASDAAFRSDNDVEARRRDAAHILGHTGRASSSPSLATSQREETHRGNERDERGNERDERGRERERPERERERERERQERKREI